MGKANNIKKMILEEQLSGCIDQEKLNIKWEDVVDLEKAKEAIKEEVTFPIKLPQLFQSKRKSWKGKLLYGLLCTGRSYLDKAAATKTHDKFFGVLP